MDEALRPQAEIGRAIGRVRAGEGRALPGRVREEGERLCRLLIGALDMGLDRRPELDDPAFDQVILDLTAALAQLHDRLGVVHLVTAEEQVYINELRIRLPGGKVGTQLSAHLALHHAGGLSFHSPLSESQMRELIAVLDQGPPAAVPLAALRRALVARGLGAVEAAAVQHFGAGQAAEAVPPRGPGTVTSDGLRLAAMTWARLVSGCPPDLLALRRLVCELLALDECDRGYWEEPTQADAHTAHLLRVCKLSLLLGRAIGLAADTLQDLGLAALLHDVGYARAEVAAASDSVGSTLARHSVAGALSLARQGGFREAKVRRVRAALEHHRCFDDARGRPALLARMLAIAEDYDTLVQSRGAGLSPHEALGRLSSGAGTIYDPRLLQIFVNRLGRYPLGTLVRLEDGRVGRVMSPARDKDRFAHPVVRIERARDGKAAGGEEIADLAADGAAAIAGVVAPKEAETWEPPVTEPAPPPGPGAAVPGEAAPAPPSEGPPLAPAEAAAAAEPAAAPPQETTPTAPPEVPPASLPEAAPPAPEVEAALPAAARRAPGKTVAELEAEDYTARPLYQGVLPTVLRDLYVARRTGVLHLTRRAERRSVRIWKGNVIHASSNRKEDHMGEVAVREGLISQADLERASKVTAQTKKRLGVVLCELGILDEEHIENALAAHAREVIVKAFAWTDGYCDFEEQEAETSWFSELALRLSTPDLILEAVRRIDDPDVVRYHLGDIDRVLVLSVGPAAKGMRVSLTPLDGYVLSRVDGTLTAREVLRIVPGEPLEVMRSLFSLICVGIVGYLGTGDGEVGREGTGTRE